MIQTAQDMKAYKVELQKALDNRFLNTTLQNFADAYKESRANDFKGIDLEALREQIASGKDAALPRLEELFLD